MSVLTVTQENFEREVLQADRPVLLDFWASWCGPCRMMSPIVDDLADQMASVLKVCKVNVEDNQDLAARFQVMSIPTLMLFKDGKAVHTVVGAVPRDRLVQELAQYL